MVSAWYGGLGSGLLATILSTLTINYFFIEPIYSLSIPNLGTLLQLGVFVMTAILINSLNAAQRSTQRSAEANLQALRESEARFGRLAESNIIGIIVVDLNGSLLEANDIFLQMVGYTQEELRSGRVHWREMTPPESLEVSERAVQELITTGVCTPFEKEYIRKDGSHIPILYGAAMTGETTFIGFVLDLSERKYREAERKRAEATQQEAVCRERALHTKVQAAKEQLETVLASINDQFLVLDREWRYTYVNDRVVEVVGMSREALLGKCIWDVFPETVGGQFYSELHRATAEQSIVHFEYFYPSWQRWFENHIYPSATGVSVLVTEITDRKRVEAALVAQEQRYRYIFEAVSVAIWEEDFSQVKAAIDQLKVAGVRDFHQYFADHPEFVQQAAEMVQLRDVNQAALQMFGAQDKAQLLTGLHQIFVAETQEAFIGELLAIAAEEPCFATETVLRTLQGDRFHVWFTIAFPSTSESYDCVLVSLLDISDAYRQATLRKEVQQELQQTLQTLRTLIQASPLPIVVIEPDMTVKLWSAAAEQLFGWSEAELLGQLLPLVPEEKQEECRQLREALTNGEVFFGVETYRRKRNGSNVVLSISAAPIYDNGGSVNAILLILQDITEQQQAQTALRDSEERLRLALMAANQGLYDLNVQTGDAIVTPEYARMLGYEPDEFQETNALWRDRLHPDDVAVVYQVYEDYVAGRRDEYRVEFRQRTQSGDWKWILSIGKIVSWESDGKPLRMLGTHTDITDRKQAEEALRQREQRLDLATSAAKLGVFEWNVEADNAVWENQLMYQIFGHTAEDGTLSKEQFMNCVLHPDDRESFELCLSEGAKPNNLFHAVCRIRRRNDSEWRWVEYSGRFTLTSDGIPLRLIGVLGDISDRKRAEAEREQLLAREQAAREQAEAANRIKDEFLAVLSHELRSPLNPILGWSKLLQTGRLDAQASHRALETIERNAKLQTQLIDDLLDVSRILRGKMALNICPINLVTIVESALETVRLAAEAKHIQIQTVAMLDNGKVFGDSARLQQIVWNLLSNAIKFTPNSGKVEIRLDQIDTYAQIQVRDTGIGISPDFLPYVFDSFRQEDGKITRKFGGLGLGLAIVRHLTELHGGTVHAESFGEGQGATFTVRLPLMAVAAASDQEISTTARSIDLSQLRILVVDDEEDMRDLVQVILEQQGAQVTVATTATEALMLFDRQPPDILISDIGMPDMDGYMLMQQIRQRSPQQGGLICGLSEAIPKALRHEVQAIALTAYAGEYDQQQALKVGFQKHIPKPVEPEALVNAISELIISGTSK
jgi:PAS domain S-box-containing protein